jgi:predicted dienelactone hydrolase
MPMNMFQAAAGLACIIMPVAAAAQTPLRAAPPAIDAPEQAAIGAPAEQMALVIWRPAGAPPSGTRFPLVVISHGTGGGPLGHVDTAEALAAAGFVVAAPMHRGDNFQDQKLVGRPEWMASRSRDVSTSIDYMLQKWAGREQLDPKRVGIFGFSAGGTTALIAAGGVPDLGRLASHCAAQREFVCTIVAEQFGTAASPPRWTHDPRVAAAVVAAPGLGFLFEPAALRACACRSSSGLAPRTRLSPTQPTPRWCGGCSRPLLNSTVSRAQSISRSSPLAPPRRRPCCAGIGKASIALPSTEASTRR